MRYALLFFVYSACAQPPTATDSLRLGLNHYGLTGWQTAQNAATLPDWQPAGYGLTQLGTTLTNGPFRRPQEPARQTTYGLSTEGLRTVGGTGRRTGWAFYGAFSYQKTDERGLAFSHGYDPFGGNPFLWADTLPGDWLRDHVRARVAIATPRLGKAGRWRLGLTLPYHVGQGARLLDPKPLYRFVDGGVLPSVWLDASARWGLGLVAGGTFSQEENEVGQFTLDFPLLYKFRGYGSFTQTPVSSAERRIGGTTWQGTVQARFRPKTGPLAAQWWAEVGAAQRTESIREGIADPVFGGSFVENRFNALLGWLQPNAAGGRRATITLGGRQGEGTDPLLRSVSASYQRLHGLIEAGNWRRTQGVFRHDFVHLSLDAFTYNDQLTRTDFSGTGLGAGYDGLRRWEQPGNSRVSRGPAWFVGLRTAVRWFPQADFRSLRPTFLTATLFRPDFLIQTTNHLRLGTSLGHDFGLRRFPGLFHRLELRADGQFTTDRGHRLTLDLLYQVRYH